MDVEKLLVRKEVANILGVGVDTISRWVDNGELKGIRFPKAGGNGRGPLRVQESEVVRFMQKHRA